MTVLLYWKIFTAIWKWAKRKNVAVDLYGLDLPQEFVEHTRCKLASLNIPANIIQADGCDVDIFSKDYFDIIISSNMVHHLRSAGQVGQFLTNVYRMSRGGWLIADFNCSILGLISVSTCVAFGGDLILTVDGIRSVRRAYTVDEIKFILSRIPDGHHMGCQSYPILPSYWTVTGKKHS